MASITALPGGGGSNITMAQPAWKNAVGRFYGQVRRAAAAAEDVAAAARPRLCAALAATPPQGVGLAANVWNVFALLASAGPGYSFVDTQGRALYYTPRPGDNMSDPVGTPAFTTGLEELLQARMGGGGERTEWAVEGLEEERGERN